MGTHMAIPDDLLEFLAKHGYTLTEGHITGCASGSVGAKHMGESLKNYEIWHVIVKKANAEPINRAVYRPTKAGLRFDWADDSDD